MPNTREGLLSMPGIGRKCADIVMSFTFGADVIAVDTHVHRVCNRIGLTDAKSADKTAQQLEERSPDWALRDGHFWLIQFGKRICTARSPKCDLCPVADLCLWLKVQQKQDQAHEQRNQNVRHFQLRHDQEGAQLDGEKRHQLCLPRL
ncbi:endonuclease III [Sphingopyxis sp. BSNA05]|uniref:endonuclease III domain-containing protein n=1 Tax=Sphingopyxis sp. BSNA05 TaxID=1236614 RepID=UPI00349F8299